MEEGSDKPEIFADGAAAALQPGDLFSLEVTARFLGGVGVWSRRNNGNATKCCFAILSQMKLLASNSFHFLHTNARS